MAGAFRLRMRGGGTSSPPEPPAEKLVPGADYDGTPGTGFGGSPPTDPTMETAKPWGLPLFPDNLPITSNTILGFDAGSSASEGFEDGVSEVRCYLENPVPVTVSAESFNFYTDVNGNQNWTFGHQFEVDVTEWLAQGRPAGRAHLYIEMVPNDTTMQNRVFGPYTIELVTDGIALPWGGPEIYDVVLEVDATQSQVAGSRYQTIKAALDYSQSSGFVRPAIYGSVTGNYPLNRVASTFNSANHWATITHAPDVTMTLTNGTSLSRADLRYDGIRFMGSGIKFDTGKMSTDFGVAYLMQTASTCSLWLDGIELTTTTPVGGVGTGAAAMLNGRPAAGYYLGFSAGAPAATKWFITDCNVHDVSNFGVAQVRLVCGTSISNCSGSGLENLGSVAGSLQRKHGCAHNVIIDKIGGYWGGLRTYEPMLQLDNTTAEKIGIARTGVNGSAGTIQGLQGFTASISGTTMTVTALTTSTVLTVGMKIWIPGQAASRTISALGTGSGGAGTYIISGSSLTVASSANFWAVMYETAIADTSGSPTMPAALASTINSTWTNWTATNLDTVGRSAIYLTMEGEPPSGGITPTEITSGDTIPSIIDAHSDGLVLGAETTFENMAMRFITMTNLVQSASISWGAGATLISVGQRNISVQDVSSTVAAPNNTPQPQYLQATVKGLLWKYISFYGCTGAFGTGQGGAAGFNADGPYSRITRCAINGIGYASSISPRPDPDMQITEISLRQNNPSSNLTDLGATDSITQDNADATLQFTDPANGDLSPLETLVIGSEAVGRYKLDGTENGTLAA